jgi:uncharacterized caspase-like protein
MRVTIALLIWLLPSAVFAQAKIALLIGNQAYDASVGILKNAHNDIAVVGEALRAQNFDVLPPIKDASRSAILGGVRELVRRLNEAGTDSIGFLYYSGHGAAEKGTNINYLIPVNAKQPGTDAFWDDSLKLDDVLRMLDGARTAAKFVIFDACRNELQLPTKDTSEGLIPVAEQEGMLVAYASSPGRTASDRGDKSGVYAAALAAELLRPGLDHLNLFQNVKEIVLASTNGAQQPWESNGLSRRVYLTGQPNLDLALAPRVSEATEVWDRTKDTKDIAVLEAFAARYNDTIYAGLATARIEALRKGASLRPTHLGTESSRPMLPADFSHLDQSTPPSDAPTNASAFDGTWLAIIACPITTDGALPYKIAVPVSVSSGVLRGEGGASDGRPAARGKPGWRTFEGRILSGGYALIDETGLTGASRYTPGKLPPGTAYSAQLEVHFGKEHGSGKRITGRFCTITFDKR